MRKSPKPSTLKPLDFEVTIRVVKGYLRTRVYQDGVGEQVIELLSEFFALWCKSIAFPELALPVIVMLKRWLKEVSPYNALKANSQQNSRQSKRDRGNKGKKGKSNVDDTAGGNRNSKLNSALALLISKLEANSKWIEQRRAKVDFAPNDRAGVEAFLKEVEWTSTPLGAFVEGQRKTREERRKVLEEARRGREEERKGRREEREGGRDDFGGDDDDFSGEEEQEEENELELDEEEEEMEEMEEE